MQFCARVLLLPLMLFLPEMPSSLGIASLTMSWGLEGNNYKEEVRTGSAAKVRSFVFDWDKISRDDLISCIGNHERASDEYFKRLRPGETPNQVSFEVFRAKMSPYCSAFSKSVAPHLYFAFVASDDREYVLESITVETRQFKEYPQVGGLYLGWTFVEKEAWYDLVLSHRLGSKTYPISEKRLRFKNSGSVILRLWSDNYYGAWKAALGNYAITIIFHFRTAGRVETTTTDRFTIDV